MEEARVHGTLHAKSPYRNPVNEVGGLVTSGIRMAMYMTEFMVVGMTVTMFAVVGMTVTMFGVMGMAMTMAVTMIMTMTVAMSMMIFSSRQEPRPILT